MVLKGAGWEGKEKGEWGGGREGVIANQFPNYCLLLQRLIFQSLNPTGYANIAAILFSFWTFFPILMAVSLSYMYSSAHFPGEKYILSQFTLLSIP